MSNKQCNEILIDIISDMTSVPNILLDYYPEFGLTEAEVIFLIEILRSKSRCSDLTIKEIANNSHYSSTEFSQLLTALVDKGFLAFNKDSELSLNAFYEKMREAWGWKKARTKVKEQDRARENQFDAEFSAIYLKFQEEMGRPLSSIEGEQIKDWFVALGMNGEMIYEALKKAVLLDKRNFQYINKILLDWQAKSYHSVQDVCQGEQGKQQKTDKKKKAAKKYRDDQKGDIFDDDMFEVN